MTASSSPLSSPASSSLPPAPLAILSAGALLAESSSLAPTTGSGPTVARPRRDAGMIRSKKKASTALAQKQESASRSAMVAEHLERYKERQE